MKQLSLSFLLFLFTYNSYAQQTKSVKNYFGALAEKYDVLKSDKNVRNGKYLLTYSYNGDVIATGFYKNNLKDSLWQYYIRKKVSAEGNYKNGLLFGEWVTYNYNGKITNKYDYTQRRLIYHKTVKADSAMHYAIVDGKTLYTKIDRAPIYLYSDDFIWDMIAHSIRYPREAREKGITGKVVVAFVINETGATSDYHILQSVGGGCDEEALRVIQNLPAAWLPGELNGNP